MQHYSMPLSWMVCLALPIALKGFLGRKCAPIIVQSLLSSVTTDFKRPPGHYHCYDALYVISNDGNFQKTIFARSRGTNLFDRVPNNDEGGVMMDVLQQHATFSVEVPPSADVMNKGMDRLKRINDGITVDNKVGVMINPICRIVAASDGKLPNEEHWNFSQNLLQPPLLLEKLDAIFHAKAHDETRRFQYMKQPVWNNHNSNHGRKSDPTTEAMIIIQEEQNFIPSLRCSLEDAGFELLSKRDYDLCEALNAEYLLRLSILPDVSQADPTIAREFYPEWFHINGTAKSIDGDDALLFDGRILVFWRGYTSEVTRGRLLLPKIDYLQASLVQKLAAYIVEWIGRIERRIINETYDMMHALQRSMRQWLSETIESMPAGRLSDRFRFMVMTRWGDDGIDQISENANARYDTEKETGGFFRLGRYGGSKIRFIGTPNPKDALNPFSICEISDICPPPSSNDHEDKLMSRIGSFRLNGTDAWRSNHGFTCLYDEQSQHPPTATQLLERVSIGNVVDSVARDGGARTLASFFSKSELVEPSFEEVVVVWRPLSESSPSKRRQLVLPKILYDIADIFDIEGLPPVPSTMPLKPLRNPLEIRAFHSVPMANLLAVLPKTKLVLRPADAFVFDLVSVVSFLLILGSQRLDSPKLDVLALVSVAFWTIRTFFRYRNKLISYDLLVKTFLTSKINHRNAGALKYVATEGGSQRALRAALAYTWMVRRLAQLRSTIVDGEGQTVMNWKITRAQLEQEGEAGVNDLIQAQNAKLVRVDMQAALVDLEELNLANFSNERTCLESVVEPEDAMDVLGETWTDLFT